jgi:predicted RNA-binding Zn ribbon-like protein
MTTTSLPATRDFQFVAGNLALDFINTVGNRLTEKRDYFRSPADLERWARLGGLLQEGETGSSVLGAAALNSRQLDRIRAAREQLYGVFHALVVSSRPTAELIAPVNALLVEVAGGRQLKCVRGKIGWEWQATRRDPLRILGPVLLSACELLTSNTLDRLRQCADAACGWLFLDRSQAVQRRWCSMADCGNRAKARRHYRRENSN